MPELTPNKAAQILADMAGPAAHKYAKAETQLHEDQARIRQHFLRGWDLAILAFTAMAAAGEVPCGHVDESRAKH